MVEFIQTAKNSYKINKLMLYKSFIFVLNMFEMHAKNSYMILSGLKRKCTNASPC